MARIVTYGRQPVAAPPGMAFPVEFPRLADLDKGTNEGFINRILASAGGDTRSLPRGLSFQMYDAPGHDDAVPAGAIFEVTIDEEAGILSGKGWLSDDEEGRKAAFAIASQKLFHNSVDLAEVTDVEIEPVGNWSDDDFHIDVKFNEWKFAKTTLVAVPAFADAYAEIDEGFFDQILAADSGPLVVDCSTDFVTGHPQELAAGMSTLPSWDYFHVAEADVPTPVTVGEPDEAGWIPVHGHLAQWSKQTRDAGGRLRHPPRARDNYANFTKPGVLTDKGMVNTGPVTQFGGHVTLKEAIENVENTWADVSVVDGKYGPWISGVVRPNVAEDTARTYAARAGQISGYWPDGQTLRLICSVNAPGYPVTPDADDSEFALAAGFAPDTLTVNDVPAALKSFKELDDDEQNTVKSWVLSALAQKDVPSKLDTALFGEQTEPEEDLTAAAADERARLLAEGGLRDLIDT